MKLRIAGLQKESIVDGPGIRFVIFTQGCVHNCPGCHNPETHDSNAGQLVSVDMIIRQIKSNPLLKGVTFSGGEPFMQADVLCELSRAVHSFGLDVITYTGYTYEDILRDASSNTGWMELLRGTDILIDGPFVEGMMSPEIKFKGSSNQRVIDVAQSIQKGRVVIISL